MLAPNKQNLLYLKRLKATILNGRKLLKEKQTGLIKTFLDTAREGKERENKLGSSLQAFLEKYQDTIGFISIESLIDELTSVASTNISVQKKRISGVLVDTISVQVQPPKRETLKLSLQSTLDDFSIYLPEILLISQLKATCSKLAKEILKVNRQIANLESQLETIDSDTKHIQSVLNERANLEKATLIQLFS